ncbi:MAG: DUF433 domain-containing protein [archaeon]|nr:DUF433 domain-containing protein [archaeon]
MEHIIIDEGVCRGKPVIKGTRITVEFILELLANGWRIEGIIENYPQLKEGDIFAALQYATSILKEESIYILPKKSSNQELISRGSLL